MSLNEQRKLDRAISNLKLKIDTEYNAKCILIETVDVKEILDYISRLENLKMVYDALFESAQLAVTCDDCPFIEDCLQKNKETEECQIKMLQRAKSLGVR